MLRIVYLYMDTNKQTVMEGGLYLPIAIRELRRLLGLTQPDLASKLRVGRITIAKWESGERRPNARNCKALMEIAVNALTSTGRLGESSREIELRVLLQSFREVAAIRTGESIRDLIRLVREARGGSADAKETLELSVLGENELRDRIGIANGATMEGYAEDARGRFYYAKKIRGGILYIIDLALAAIHRELERLGAKRDDLPELERLIVQELCSRGAGTVSEGFPVTKKAFEGINSGRPKDS